MDSSRQAQRIAAGSLVILAVVVSCAPLDRQVERTSRSYSAYMKGLLTDRAGTFHEAVVHYRAAQKLDQKSVDPRFQLGLDYIGLKDYKRAVDEFQAILRLEPLNDDARYVLAFVYAQLGDYKKAAEQYEILLVRAASLQQQTQLRRILSQLYFLAGNDKAAERHTQKILQINPLDTDALYFMGLLSSETARTEDAVAYFQKVLEYDPQDSDAANSLAFMYAEEGRHLNQALDLAEKVVRDEPSNGAYLDTLGWIYFKLGDIDKAVLYLEKAAKLLVDPAIFNHLAEAYEARLDKTKARRALQTSFSLDPSQKDVRKKLDAYLKH